MLSRLLNFHRRRAMDPLQVSMTGVRMGERFLQIGCDDRALLGGLAAKVGLSGAAAVAVFDDRSAARARKIAAKAGALVDVQVTTPSSVAVDANAVDMVVIDDTHGCFAKLSASDRRACLARALRAVRAGGRVEWIEQSAAASAADAELQAAGFKPVRVLADTNGLRFVEGLRT